ncbi:hypothetical protein Mal4_43310 [Maioricimonas rarisocia]|uniref:Type II secretion system protein n=1 Tax=Maioricimonas rarisocia TaxID=2528026 RepID=A0A517ZBY5_9PLAN|nr:hypothetical protein [Maioricimonas rarisocia]QDU39977.1 hypothetical protein Mal4_43310 [Maioricimonas rarisocia]
MTSMRTHHPTSRAAISSLEIVIAGGLLGLALITVLPVASRAGAVRSELADRAAARQLVANVLERVLTHTAGNSTDGGPTTSDIESATIPAETMDFLDDPQFDIRVETIGDEPSLRRVTATLSWTSRNGEPARPVALTAWIPPAEEQP